MDGEGVHVWCEDLLLVDQLYQGLSFAHRKELHKMAARWMLDTTDKEERQQYIPHIIHHMMMSQHESQASSFLKKAQNLERSATLQDQIMLKVRWYLDTKSLDYARAQVCLRAIPFLRGLAKALDQQRVSEKVSIFGSRLVAGYRQRKVSIASPGHDDEVAASRASEAASSRASEADGPSSLEPPLILVTPPVADVTPPPIQTLEETPAASAADQLPGEKAADGKTPAPPLPPLPSK